MTDSEKLDLLITKVITIEDKVGTLTGNVGTLEHDVSGLKEQMIKSTKELKTMDKAILDEIERVHDILNKHKSDKNAHMTLLRYE